MNGATIRREPPRGRITYCYVELERHALLLAEGLPAESYLDTGNRGWFSAEAGVRPLFPDLAAPRTWAADACADLVLTGPALHAAHARLAQRAHHLGWSLTDDPALAVTADGAALPLRRRGALQWSVPIPPGARTLRLRSRSFVPSDLDRQADDRRRLGIAVAALAGADVEHGDGWHDPEPGWRWTDGDAGLTLTPCRHPGTLRIAAVQAGARYWQERSGRAAASALSGRNKNTIRQSCTSLRGRNAAQWRHARDT